jgi:hemerythrin-like domain-containing protein
MTMTRKGNKKASKRIAGSTAQRRRPKRQAQGSRAPRSATRRQGNGATSHGPDALALLRRDHQTLRRLFSELQSAKSADKQTTLLNELEAELKQHTLLEENIFYPAYRDKVQRKEDRQLYYEAVEEHHAVDLVLPEVKRAEPASDMFSARVKVLKELVEHHADEEEKEMFPRAHKLMGAEHLRKLGQEIAERKEESTHGGALNAVASILGIR